MNRESKFPVEIKMLTKNVQSILHYSKVSNKRRVGNKRRGWHIWSDLIKEGVGIKGGAGRSLNSEPLFWNKKLLSRQPDK